MQRVTRHATLAETLRVVLHVVPVLSMAAVTITPGSHHWMYAGAGSGRLSSWAPLARATSADATFRAARAGVWVFGDSITVADYPDLAARLTARGIRSAVDAQSGLPTVPAVDRLAARVAVQGVPRVLVMATGSNDIFRPTYIGPAAKEVRALVGPTTRIVWVNVHAKRTDVSSATRANDVRNTRTVNAAIAAAPTDRVVDWHGFLDKAVAPAEVYLSDGVHTTPVGRAARNALIVAQVAQVAQMAS